MGAHSDILAFLDRLSEMGSHFRADEMDAMYTEDFGIWVLTPAGAVACITKEEMLQRLRSLHEAGAPPLLMERRVLRIDQHGDEATAIMFRRMSDHGDPVYLALHLKKTDGKWRAGSKTVIPWPNRDNSLDFLPPGVR